MNKTELIVFLNAYIKKWGNQDVGTLIEDIKNGLVEGVEDDESNNEDSD